MVYFMESQRSVQSCRISEFVAGVGVSGVPYFCSCCCAVPIMLPMLCVTKRSGKTTFLGVAIQCRLMEFIVSLMLLFPLEEEISCVSSSLTKHSTKTLTCILMMCE